MSWNTGRRDFSWVECDGDCSCMMGGFLSDDAS
ncbi:unnamed protein product [Phyllotreta striolata]|uniref:Uncharacterized protein n=1 Tax=Phyllotreta striolata TaxID=444603 RepID=A0A9N9U1G8_PHYSR|nr:unnamed protein product [Phyllotreta striolata]